MQSSQNRLSCPFRHWARARARGFRGAPLSFCAFVLSSIPSSMVNFSYFVAFCCYWWVSRLRGVDVSSWLLVAVCGSFAVCVHLQAYLAMQ